MNTFDWNHLGSIPPEDLADARLQLHWASQLVASIGNSFTEPEPDWGHVSLDWTSENRIRGRWTSGPHPFRAVLDPSRLVLSLNEDEGVPVSGLPLLGRTLEDAYEWLETAVDEIQRSGGFGLVRPDHSMLRHPVESGAPLKPSREHLKEVCNWFKNAALVLNVLADREDDVSPIRLWPHHFDLSMLIPIDADQDSEDARSISVGFSPGDSETDTPYWYVTPWPSPEPDELPKATLGEWLTDEWTGLVLSSARTVEAETAEEQKALVRSFLEDGTRICRDLLG